MESSKLKSERIVTNTRHSIIPLTLFLISSLVPLLCSMTVISCSTDNGTAPDQTTGSVMGSVKDEAGNSYPNTLVELATSSKTLEATTDSNGNFNFTDISATSYNLAIKLPLSTEFAVNSPATITVMANQTIRIDLVIQPKPVEAHLNFGNVQLLEEIVDKDGNTPTSPNELLYAANIFDPPLGLLTPITTPDGHHLTLSEFQTAKGSLTVYCNGNSSTVEITLAGMIPGGTYTFWLAYLNRTRKVGESIDFMNDFVNFTNPPIGSSNGTENIVVADLDGTISAILEHGSCILTDEVALVIPVLYHINGKTFGGGHVPDPEEMVHMLVYFQ